MLASRIATTISVAALVLVPVACGGDDSSDVTKEEFIANADAVCKETNDKIEALVDDLSEDTSAEEAAQFTVDEAIPLFRDQIDQLRDLDLPAADADDIEQLWDDLDTSTDELEQQLKDDPEVAFSEDFDPFADENKAATDYGFKECGG
jgi:hypothetical protein